LVPASHEAQADVLALKVFCVGSFSLLCLIIAGVL